MHFRTAGGAHRGSQGADAVCGDGSFLCNFIAFFIQSCDTATFWLRSSDDVQVRGFSNSPARSIYLIGGYEAIFGASTCLDGEDDGIVQHASQYACNGSATASYNNSNVCNNSAKQESAGFLNLDVGHENHSDERDDSDSDTRRQVPGWPDGPGTHRTPRHRGDDAAGGRRLRSAHPDAAVRTNRLHRPRDRRAGAGAARNDDGVLGSGSGPLLDGWRRERLYGPGYSRWASLPCGDRRSGRTRRRAGTRRVSVAAREVIPYTRASMVN